MTFNQTKYDYLIVGAGLFGATFADIASKNNKKCLVIEKRNHIAGNAYTENAEAITVHKYGAHIFHTNDRQVWEYINLFSEFNRYTHAVMANYDNEIYNLPFNMNTFYRLWGTSKPSEAKTKIDSQKEKMNHPKNLEEQAIALAGTDIYEKFIKGYTEKQWGRDCSKLPPFIIKRIPLRFTFNNEYFNDHFQGIPVDGYTSMIGRMLENCEVSLNTDFFGDRNYFENIAGKIVYTGMIDEFFQYKYGALEYRSLRFEEEIMDAANFQGCAVMNYTAANIPFTRIIEHKHFAAGEQLDIQKTIITREYPKEYESGDLPYYPVNDEKNDVLYARYRSDADQLTAGGKFIFGGRLADYRYYDMWQVIRNALDISAEICGKQE